MRKHLILVGIVVALLYCRQQPESAVIITEDNEKILWYNQPAEEWMTQALPIDNGSVGAMIFGGIEKEHIQFNEQSLLGGKPNDHLQPSFQKKS